MDGRTERDGWRPAEGGAAFWLSNLPLRRRVWSVRPSPLRLVTTVQSENGQPTTEPLPELSVSRGTVFSSPASPSLPLPNVVSRKPIRSGTVPHSRSEGETTRVQNFRLDFGNRPGVHRGWEWDRGTETPRENRPILAKSDREVSTYM